MKPLKTPSLLVFTLQDPFASLVASGRMTILPMPSLPKYRRRSLFGATFLLQGSVQRHDDYSRIMEDFKHFDLVAGYPNPIKDIDYHPVILHGKARALVKIEGFVRFLENDEDTRVSACMRESVAPGLIGWRVKVVHQFSTEKEDLFRVKKKSTKRFQLIPLDMETMNWITKNMTEEEKFALPSIIRESEEIATAERKRIKRKRRRVGEKRHGSNTESPKPSKKEKRNKIKNTRTSGRKG